ncbi:Probable cytochrome P450 [Mycobacteroides abscessus subsp. abscessus]|nr:Probable cytochrome P450 [Mycobacteroides abscessus subsp. abscessus]
MTTPTVPRVSGGEDQYGHLEEFRTDPIALMKRIRAECGNVGTFQLADKQVVFLSGAEANEFFFRSSDEDLDQAEAYPFMTPIFGKGVVFDADPERRKEMLHNAALRGEQMKGHAATIENEVRQMISRWGESGEVDLLDFFAELTIYTSSACLIGKKFRDELDGRFAHLYHQLEQGTDPLCYVDPYLEIESFRQRDEARTGLVALVQEIINGRVQRSADSPTDKSQRDMLDVLIMIKDEHGNPRFTADEITGMFISMMFAGHHTSSGTASWVLIELLRHPDIQSQVIDELDELYADGSEVSFHALRQIPKLENVLKETLRLHPPLIEQMKGHAATIENEVRQMISRWGESGEVDLLDFFAELTIYTSSACLIGKKFRDELDGRFAHLYHQLEQGTDPLCYVDPYLEIESFRQRDEARTGLVALVQEIINGRVQRSADSPADKSQRDMLDVLIMIKDEHGNPRFTADEITGMFISMMFAGHHTSSGTASWVLIELLRHPDIRSQVIDELDELYADGGEVSFHALRQIPKLENVLKETLRLHPPLIILMRVAKGEFEVGGFPIHDGDMVAASPAVSNRIAEDFPNPDGFVPDRYEKPRQEDIVNRWTWIPFGAGRHRCVGAAFATMQIKAIFSVLLREYEFEMAQPADSYHNDHSKMVVQLAQPAKVRYRKRSA